MRPGSRPHRAGPGSAAAEKRRRRGRRRRPPRPVPEPPEPSPDDEKALDETDEEREAKPPLAKPVPTTALAGLDSGRAHHAGRRYQTAAATQTFPCLTSRRAAERASPGFRRGRRRTVRPRSRRLETRQPPACRRPARARPEAGRGRWAEARRGRRAGALARGLEAARPSAPRSPSRGRARRTARRRPRRPFLDLVRNGDGDVEVLRKL